MKKLFILLAMGLVGTTFAVGVNASAPSELTCEQKAAVDAQALYTACINNTPLSAQNTCYMASVEFYNSQIKYCN